MKKTLTRVLSLVLVLTMFLTTAPLALADDPEVIPLTGVTISGPSLVAMGDRGVMSAAKDPGNSTEKLVWVSSNPEVATVSSGSVSPKAPGTTTITAKSPTDDTVVSNEVTIRVAYVPSVSSSTLTVEAGKQANVPTVTVPGLDSFEVLWSVENGTGTATVDGTTGKVTGGTAGTATLVGRISGADASHFSPDNTVEIGITITAAQTGTYEAALSSSSMELKIDEPKDLPTIGGLGNLGEGTDYNVDWTGNTGITVNDATKKVTGDIVGNTTLTATITPKEGSNITITPTTLTCNVKVMPNPSLASQTMQIEYGATPVAAPTVLGLDGLRSNEYNVTWTGGSNIVEVVNQNTFRGIGTGTVAMTGKVVVTKDGFKMEKDLTCNVTVTSSLYMEVSDSKISLAAQETHTVPKPTLKGSTANDYTITSWACTKTDNNSNRTTISDGSNGSKVITAKYTGLDVYKITGKATNKTNSSDVVDLPPITVSVSVYGEAPDITVVLKDSVSSFTFDDTGVYTSLKLDQSEKLNSYSSVEALLLSEFRYHLDGRDSELSAYDLTFTSMVGEGGELSQAASGMEGRTWFNMNGLEYIKYTKDRGTATKSRFTYNVWDQYNMLVMTGDIIIDYKDTAEIVYYCDGDPITFDENDFEEFWIDYSNTSYNLDYVTFDKMPDTYDGKLYTTANMTTTAKTNYKFEPNHTGSANHDLDTVTFDPAATFSGTVYIPFTAVGTNGKQVSGTVAITDEEGGADIEYNCDGTPVIFDENDFEDFWDDYGTNNKSLKYVTFDQLPSSTTEGVLYTNSNQTTKVKTSDKFEPNHIASTTYKDLDTVTFDPASKAEDTIYIPFTAVGTDDKEVSGTVAIIMGGDSDLTITKLGFRFGQTSAKLDKAIAEEFEDEKDEELDYVTFSIPDKEIGQLFYDYNTAKDTLLDAELITNKTKLYYDATGSQYDLADVHFFPSECCPKEVTLSYTAYGEDGTTYKGTVTLTVITQNSSSKFKDVKGGTGWAADSVDFLNYHGVVNGIDSNNFGPSNKITRGDFMLMLYRAFLKEDYEDTTISSNFADVTKGTSDYSKELYQAIGIAKKLGIATGDGTNYYPKKNISREEAMTLIYRTLDELKIDLTVTSSKDTKDFSDYSKVSTYAKDPIEYLIEHDIVRGDAGKINPKNNITRAEMAVILHRVLTF